MDELMPHPTAARRRFQDTLPLAFQPKERVGSNCCVQESTEEDDHLGEEEKFFAQSIMSSEVTLQPSDP